MLVITKAGAEGLDLKETRSIVIIDPTFNPSSIEQIIGRGVRYKSHEHLPVADRVVNVYFMELVKPVGIAGSLTGDQILYNIIATKDYKNDIVKDLLIGCSV